VPKSKKKARAKTREVTRRVKKKISFLTTEGIDYVDWKNEKLLRKFMSERAKIRARRVTGNSAQQQKLVADAIKLAREMALVPYGTKVTTQRQMKERDGRPRADGPAPLPSSLPPGSDLDEFDQAEGSADNGASEAVELHDPSDAELPVSDESDSQSADSTAGVHP